MTPILEMLDRIERMLIALLASAALFLACLSMLGRYVVPGLTLDWTFELTIFTTIWATFLAGARTAGKGGHVRVDTLLALMPPGLRLALVLLACVASVAVALFLLHSGIVVVEEAYRWDERTTSTLRLPLWIYYLSLPVGAALIASHLVVRAFLLVTGKASDEIAQREP